MRGSACDKSTRVEATGSKALQGGGEMGTLMRALDWSRTALGAVESWPQSLRTAVSILLETRFAMYIAWGPGYAQLYNDGYRPILGSTKHPAALGRGASETFAESWHIIGPMFDDVRRGNATGAEDWMLPLDRHGYLEECYFTFSYSPIRDESAGVGGVLVTVSETTSSVLANRRLKVLHALTAETAQVKNADEACVTAARALATDVADVPFALLFLLDPGGAPPRLVASSGVDTAASAQLPIASAASWPLQAVLEGGGPVVVDDVIARFGALPGGPWPEPPSTAILLPIARPGQEKPYGVLVAGVSPRRALDQPYRDFFSLVAGHVATAVTSARAFDEEHRRASELAALDRAKTTFFSNVSHELRTPLTLLVGPAEEALASPSLPEPERQRWLLVQRNAHRLSRLVNTLLDFARIEAGRADASYVPTDLAALTGELSSMFRSAVERAGLRLTLALEPIGPVFVDREMWEKIVLNLLSNALKFTFEGGITVSLRRLDGSALLTVEDTGVGIPQDEAARIFDRFHRIRGARSRTHEGTGIGLALVQELVRLHGGAIAASSEPGRGAKFTVTLPLGDAHLPRERVSAARVTPISPVAAQFVEEARGWTDAVAEASPVVPSGRKRERILLADDNADMREYVTRLLRERWDVEAVADGEAALLAVRRNPPDLVLSDVMMPRLDGFGLLRALRTDPATRTTPVILLSARAGEESTAEGLDSGANDYLVKPFSARDLLVRVAAQLGTAQARREVAQATERERERLYTHFMQAPFPIAVLRGPEHVFELVNDQCFRVWGKDASIVGKTLRAGFPELIGQPFPGYLDGVLQTGLPYEGNEELARIARGPGGALEDVYFNFVYSPLRDRDGRVDGVLLCGFEVTQQVLARRTIEDALAAAARLNDELTNSERLFRTLANHLPELAWSARPDGYIDFYNERWYEYTGTTPAQMQGWGWKSVHDPAMVDQVIERWQHSIDSGERFEMEFPLRGVDGTFRWFLTRVEPVRDDRGQIVRWIGTNSDINAQREARRRTEEFLAMLGHELRNPLAPIATAVRLMELKGDDKLTRERKVIERQVAHLTRLIDDLLDVSRIAQGKIELARETVDLAEVVAKAVEQVSPLLEGKSHRLAVDVPQGTLFAHADPVRLAQVIANLLGNAAKYTPARGSIELAAMGDQGQVVLRVKDNGIGISPDLLPRVFDLFVQGQRALDRAEGGLGLGLAVVKNLVTLHGGTVTVHSDGADRGSEFTVRLPLAGIAAPAQAPAQARKGDQSHRRRILVVDDNIDAADTLATALEMMGHEVRIANDGPHALETMKRFAPEIGVLDLGLPVMDGYELATRMRELAAGHPLRLIAVTGYGQPEDQDRSRSAGFDAHLVKPVELEHLGRVIAQLGARAPAPQASLEPR